jgi:hypothetical protein
VRQRCAQVGEFHIKLYRLGREAQDVEEHPQYEGGDACQSTACHGIGSKPRRKLLAAAAQGGHGQKPCYARSLLTNAEGNSVKLQILEGIPIFVGVAVLTASGKGRLSGTRPLHSAKYRARHGALLR